jgi:hypothetical protein
MDQLIFEAESLLAKLPSVTQALTPALPGGLEEGLILHYGFDDKSDLNVKDASIHGNHGVIKGAKWSQYGRRGGAYWFDGIDDYIYSDLNEPLEFGEHLTVSICVFRKSADKLDQMDPEYLLSTGDRSRAGLWLYLTPAGGVGAGLTHIDPDGSPLRVAAEPSRHRVIDDQWIHLVLTYDGRIVRTYVDGQEDKLTNLPGGKGISNGPINIGRKGNGQWQYGFKGKLDDLIIWNRALKEVEVLGLWASMTRVDE